MGCPSDALGSIAKIFESCFSRCFGESGWTFSLVMGNDNSTMPFEPKESCGGYNVTVAFIADDDFRNFTGRHLVEDVEFYPINTFSFFNAFVLFCLQGLIFKPISRLLRNRFLWYKETFYPRDKLFNNSPIARIQTESLHPFGDSSHANAQPMMNIDSANERKEARLPIWARFLQNNVMCFCDPLFVLYHTLFHVAHFVYLLVHMLNCGGYDFADADHPCYFAGKPWLQYQAFYLRFVLSGNPTFFSLFLLSCFVHEGGVLVGFNLTAFYKHKLHGVCLLVNIVLLLPAILTHSIPMIIVYSPFIILLCVFLSVFVVSLTRLLNYLWDTVDCCARACDGRAILLVIQIIMKVTGATPLSRIESIVVFA
jgi:hypothetical protein